MNTSRKVSVFVHKSKKSICMDMLCRGARASVTVHITRVLARVNFDW